MGRAKILYGVETGVYRIQIDYGSEKKESELQKFTVLVNKLDQRISQAQQAVSAEEQKEEPLLLNVSTEIGIYETALQNLKPNQPVPKPTAYLKALKELQAQQAKTKAAKSLLELIKKAKADNLKKVAYWQTFSPLEERNAWGLGFYGFVPAGTVLSTVDIPGDDQAVMLGTGEATDADGRLFATDVMSPEQAFFNAAILPGWQRHKPFYRKGTITAINRGANTCFITLDSESSMAQGLNVNEVSALADVPFVYGTCGHQAFVTGDRVIVKFTDNDWKKPSVIAFWGPIQHPCPTFGRVGITLSYSWNQRSGPADGKVWADLKKWCLGASYSQFGFLLGQFVLAARCKVYELVLSLNSATYIESTTGTIEGHAFQQVSLGSVTWRWKTNDESIPSTFKLIMPNSDDSATDMLLGWQTGTTKLTVQRVSYGVQQMSYDTQELYVEADVPYVISTSPDSGPQFSKQSTNQNQTTFPADPPGIYGNSNTYIFPDENETEETSIESLFGLPQINVNFRGRRMLYELTNVTHYNPSGDIGTILRLEYSPTAWEDGNV